MAAEELTRLVAAIPTGLYRELVETLGAVARAAGEPQEDDWWMAMPDEDEGVAAAV